MSHKTLLDALTPETIERLQQLELFSRHRVAEILKGENRAVLKGLSTDFVSHRPYFPGDELRHVDWRAYGRTDRLVLKQYEDVTNVHVAVALDVSGSMAFGDGSLSKHYYAVRSAALVLFLAYLRRDKFSLHLFSDRLRRTIPPGTGRQQLLRTFAELASCEPTGGTSFDITLAEIDASTRRRSILMLLSDCMVEPEALARQLMRFRRKGTDVICFQVFHPAERDFPPTLFMILREKARRQGVGCCEGGRG
jgi:uncharacterized protein (DUF58 family)